MLTPTDVWFFPKMLGFTCRTGRASDKYILLIFFSRLPRKDIFLILLISFIHVLVFSIVFWVVSHFVVHYISSTASMTLYGLLPLGRMFSLLTSLPCGNLSPFKDHLTCHFGQEAFPHGYASSPHHCVFIYCVYVLHLLNCKHGISHLSVLLDSRYCLNFYLYLQYLVHSMHLIKSFWWISV